MPPYHPGTFTPSHAMRERTIASHFVRAALRGADRQGYDYAALLREVGIQPALLDEPRARLAPEQFTRCKACGRCSTTSTWASAPSPASAAPSP
jgi:hypothetical protein